MRICGVELSANDAVICLLNKEGQLYDLPDCRVRSLTLPKDHSREDLQQFQFAFSKLMEDYQVKKVAIRERLTKGKFAGGAISFKLESAIQLCSGFEVELYSAATMKAVLNEAPVPVPFSETGLKAFQESAFNVAYVAHEFRPENKQSATARSAK